MNLLLIGSGGREHALAWKLSQSPRCDTLFIAPGNPGTAQCGTNVSLDPLDFPAVHRFVLEHQVDMVVVGPEQPLVEGMADYLGERGVPVIGPRKAGALLEGSKSFSKAFMEKYGIPSARYASFSEGQLAEALAYVAEHPLPVVVKASGLAAGKGVLICETHSEAAEAVSEMLSGKAFGDAGRTVVIEQFLKGIEISVFVLTDGKDYVILPSAKDYKRIGEGDTGLNTGGMGAVSPVPFADAAFMQRVEKTVVQPTVHGLMSEGIHYQGFIFIGLMVEGDIPWVLEYNVRMGDPETEVVIPRLKNDLVELFEATVNGQLGEVAVETDPRTCVTVMLVSGGYPGSYAKGKEMQLPDPAGSMLFHAGTRKDAERLLSDGGRVLAISSFGENIGEAVSQSLELAEKVQFEGKYYRKDIGQDLIRLQQM
ncbi:MAG: phosphoribosylamine--glycine ligase [Bacteroidetes bacterium]|nr:MAG: phosphoribosylamine--glycine ligase [Bacteroidota bacterium]